MAVIRNRGTGGAALNGDEVGTVGLTYIPDEDATSVIYPEFNVSGQRVRTTTASLWTFTEYDIALEVALTNYATSTQFLAGRYGAGAAREFAIFWTGTSNKLRWWGSADGTNQVQQIESDALDPAPANGDRLKVRVTCIPNNGVGNSEIKFYRSYDWENWDQIGSTFSGSAYTPFNVAGNIDYAQDANNGGDAYGRYYRGWVRNSIDGPYLSNWDARFLTSGTSLTIPDISGVNTVATFNATGGNRRTFICATPTWITGNGTFFRIPDNSLLNFGPTDSFTLMTAHRLRGNGGSYFGHICKQSSSVATTAGYALMNNGTSAASQDDLRFLVGDGTSGSVVTLARATTAEQTVFAIRDVTADTLRIQNEGTLSASVSDPTTGTLENTNPVAIGAYSNSSSVNGIELFGVAIFDRALNTAERTLIDDFFDRRVG